MIKPDNVQPVSSLAMDHWGYYNGQHELNNGTRLFIPYGRYYVNDDYYFHYGDSARECNEYHMKTGVLTDIFSPEGVRTNFSYEANRTERYSAVLRITKRKSIWQEDCG